MKSNLQRLQERLASQSVPSLLISENSNVQWVSGFTGTWGFVLATPSKALFITDSRYTVQAGEEIAEMPVLSYASPVELTDFVKEQLVGFGVSELGFEAQNVSYATYTDWKAKFAPVELVPVKEVLEPLRLVKSADEIAKIRKACELADACFKYVVPKIQPGVTEYDLAMEIDFYFRRQGAESAFRTIVVSGERSARPHGVPSEKKLERGDFVTMDFGAKLDGYNSDLTRTVVVGVASDRHSEVYHSVLDAQMTAISAMKPGMSAGEIDRLSRKVLAQKGLDVYFGHGLGHSLGKVVHDGGRMNSSSTTTLEPGQVWTVEPGVYIEGFGGVRIEDDVVVTEDGVEVLTHSPKELMTVG